MSCASILGLIGDSFTFVVGVLLAWEAIRKEHDFMTMREQVKTLQDPLLAKVNFTKKGISLHAADGVEKATYRVSRGEPWLALFC